MTSYSGILLRYFCTFILTAVIFNHFLQEGFGRVDFLPFVFWGLPSLFINSAIIFYILRIIKKQYFIIRFFIQFIVVIVVSVFGTISYSLLLGAWAGALGFANPFLVHLAGAFAGSFWIEGQSGSRIKKIAVNLCMYLFVIIFFGVGLYHVSLFINSEIRGGREIEIVIASETKRKFNNEQDVKNYYCSEIMESKNHFFPHVWLEDERGGKKKLCSPYNLKAYIDLYKSKGVVFRSKRASSHLTYYKKKVTVFLIFPDIYELSPPGEFFKIPKDDSVIYFHDGTQWDFFPKEVEFSKQQIAIRFKKYHKKFCLSIEGAPGHLPLKGCYVFLR